jgi:glycerol-3-phosphate O-acyltransferase
MEKTVLEITAFWDIALCSLVEVARRLSGAYSFHHRSMMDAVRISETSVYFNETTPEHIPEGCNLHTRAART